MITNVQLIKTLLGLQMHDGGVTYLKGKRTEISDTGIVLCEDVDTHISWSDLNAQIIKTYWYELSSLYNKDVLCAINFGEYISGLIAAPETRVISYNNNQKIGLCFYTLEVSGKEYRICASAPSGVVNMFAVNTRSIPEVPGYEHTPSLCLRNAGCDLLLSECGRHEGMYISLRNMSFRELCDMIGVDLFSKVNMFGTDLDNRSTMKSSAEELEYPAIASLSCGDMESSVRYETLVQAVKCLGTDAVDQLNAVLEVLL